MRYQFYREHKYVSAALNDLERLIARSDFCNEESRSSVEKMFQGLKAMLKGHAEYENQRLHYLLKQKNVPASVYKHVEEDHADQDQRLDEIESQILGIAEEPSKEKKIELGFKLYLTFRKFVADNLAHLHEEETEILPALQQLYSDEELRQVEASSYRAMTSEEILGMVQVLFPHMNVHDKEAFLSDIRSLVPEKFAVIRDQVNLSS